MKSLLLLLSFLSFSQISYAQNNVPFSAEMKSPIKHYNRENALLATSGALGQGALKELSEKGITTIINLRTKPEGADDEGKRARKLGLKYINIPVTGGTVTDDKILAELTKNLDDITTPTLLHCGSGNRVGALLTRYYISKNMDPKLAFERGRAAGMKPSLEAKVQKVLKTSIMKKDVFVFITSADQQTQFMALTLANKMKDQQKQVKLLLCSHGGDIALKSKAKKEAKKTTHSLLKRLIKNGASVQVCPLYLPSRNNASPTDFVEGVTQAHPNYISQQLLNDDAKLFTF